MGRDREDQEKLDAELGYSVRGEREVKLREWFSLHEDGERAGDFDRKVAVLRAKKWAKEHPSRRQAIALKYARKPTVKQRQLDLARKRRHARHAATARVFVCQLDYCRVKFCQVPWCAKGPAPRYCSDSHSSMAYVRRKKKTSPARQYTCGLCKGQGHSRRGCPTDPPRDTPKEEM